MRSLRFGLIFAGLLVVGFGILLAPPVQSVDAAFSRWLVGVSDGLIRLCGGVATRQGAILRAPSGFGVEMRDGCNAANVTIFLWSAILAFPASWKMKGLGLVAGGVIIHLINILRFISLYYLGQYSMTLFDFAHNFLWESMLVMDTMVIFWLWVNRVLR